MTKLLIILLFLFGCSPISLHTLQNPELLNENENSIRASYSGDFFNLKKIDLGLLYGTGLNENYTLMLEYNYIHYNTGETDNTDFGDLTHFFDSDSSSIFNQFQNDLFFSNNPKYFQRLSSGLKFKRIGFTFYTPFSITKPHSNNNYLVMFEPTVLIGIPFIFGTELIPSIKLITPIFSKFSNISLLNAAGGLSYGRNNKLFIEMGITIPASLEGNKSFQDSTRIVPIITLSGGIEIKNW